MYVGKFEDIIPFNSKEGQEYVERVKKSLNAGSNHGFSNFEFTILRTIESQQQEIEQFKKLIEEAAEEIENCYGKETNLSKRLRDKALGGSGENEQ